MTSPNRQAAIEAANLCFQELLMKNSKFAIYKDEIRTTFEAGWSARESEVVELKAKLKKAAEIHKTWLTVNAKLHEGKLNPENYAKFWMDIYDNDLSKVAREALKTESGGE